MAKWEWSAVIVLGTIVALGVGLLATPVTITTPGQLIFAVNQACTQADKLQTGAQIICNQVQERLVRELEKNLRQHGSIKLDPQLIGEALALTARWDKSTVGADNALQLAISLTALLNKGAYGKTLYALLGHGQAAGYTPGEITALVTKIADMATARTPAAGLVDDALKHLDVAMMGGGQQAGATVQPGINHSHSQQHPAISGHEQRVPVMEPPQVSSKNGPAVGNEHRTATGVNAATAAVNSVKDQRQAMQIGPKLSHQSPGSDKGNGTKVAVLPAMNVEKDEGVAQQGQEHKKGDNTKKNHSGKGK